MKLISSTRITFIVLFSLIMITPVFSAQPIVCNQQYALCTSAACQPDASHPGYAICACDVMQGDSAGYASCKDRAPKQDNGHTTRLISTFSFAQFDTKQAMNCPKGMPWTDCVDSPCKVNSMQPNKAMCKCPIKHEEAFFTFGGDCKTNTCLTGYWSGSTEKDGIVLRNAMMKKLNITKNPWPNAACPVPVKQGNTK